MTYPQSRDAYIDSYYIVQVGANTKLKYENTEIIAGKGLESCRRLFMVSDWDEGLNPVIIRGKHQSRPALAISKIVHV